MPRTPDPALKVNDPVDALTDCNMPLGEVQVIIRALIRRYGAKARLATDAGHNNVSFFVERP